MIYISKTMHEEGLFICFLSLSGGSRGMGLDFRVKWLLAILAFPRRVRAGGVGEVLNLDLSSRLQGSGISMILFNYALNRSKSPPCFS